MPVGMMVAPAWTVGSIQAHPELALLVRLEANNWV